MLRGCLPVYLVGVAHVVQEEASKSDLEEIPLPYDEGAEKTKPAKKPGPKLKLPSLCTSTAGSIVTLAPVIFCGSKKMETKAEAY